MDKFFKETLFTNFIKYTLKENPLPIYKIIRENDYMVEGVTYTHKDKILKCTQSGIFSYTPGEDVAKFTTIATYSPKAYSPKYTYNYNSQINYYDYETHRYFGEYLRQLENIYNLNLLPLYNCFSYYEVNNITLTETVSNGVLTKNKEDYRVFLIPIKFDRTYTIALESDIPIPVSATAIRSFTISLSVESSIAAILTLTPPSDVNLIAFESRQLSTCCIR